jgi:tRNA (cmo5U34)-methyltransferase
MFSGPHVATSYCDGPPRQVPGYDALLRMTIQLLAEQVSSNGRVLVHGAGGGLELQAMADAQQGWRFDGVDPSADMLALAARTAAQHIDRITLHEGYIDSAPLGPFEGATSILVSHFIAKAQRLETLQQIRKRLKTGAPLVIAHISFPKGNDNGKVWLKRQFAYRGMAEDQMNEAMEMMLTRLTILSPREDEELLREAGFNDVGLFYAGLSFRGWVASA